MESISVEYILAIRFRMRKDHGHNDEERKFLQKANSPPPLLISSSNTSGVDVPTGR